MELPDDAPKTPKLYFLASDVLLIAVAVLIAARSGTPLPPAAIYAIAGCVLAGALLLVLPFLIDYNRRQDMLLTERQNALEALVRTTNTAVEQASIAASGLNEIAELSQKNLRLADQLPQKLHERINEFNHHHEEALAEELESLQQEVNTLRASEAEKLESAADKVQRAAAEFAKLEQVVRSHVASLDDAAKRAEQIIAHAANQATREIDQRLAQALKSATAAAAAVQPKPAPAPAAPPPEPVAARPEPAPPPPRIAPASATPPPAVVTAPKTPTPPAPPPAPAAPENAAAHPAPPEDRGAVAVAAPPHRKTAAKRHVTETAPPLFPSGLRNDSAPLEGAPERAPETIAPFSMPQRASVDESTQLSPDEAQPETALSSDGQTRLVVTAYIGIGNKLFIRGEGPGLSWDRGVPLQFVSIGKWRWETADATHPVSAKLYKNDQVECSTIGTIQLQPGHQCELSATF